MLPPVPLSILFNMLARGIASVVPMSAPMSLAVNASSRLASWFRASSKLAVLLTKEPCAAIPPKLATFPPLPFVARLIKNWLAINVTACPPASGTSFSQKLSVLGSSLVVSGLYSLILLDKAKYSLELPVFSSSRAISASMYSGVTKDFNPLSAGLYINGLPSSPPLERRARSVSSFSKSV